MAGMIEIENLSKRFGPVLAVDDVSFSVARGEVLGFLGPNGAGKSTTMRMIAGFLPPSEGTARVCGYDVRGDPIAARRHLGYLPEGAPLYSDMTPRAFLQFIAAIRGFSGAAKRDRVGRAVEMVELRGALDQPIETLSKGYKRRVGLAQALLHDPDVLILDEPTDGLDPNQKNEVRTLIRAMAAEKAIIISTHILEEVDAACTRAMIIAEGRIVADGTPEELEARSRYFNAVAMTVHVDLVGSVRSGLAQVAGVADIQDTAYGNGMASLTVFAKEGQPLFGEVSDLVRANSWEVAELRIERGRLDDVFRQVTRSDGS